MNIQETIRQGEGYDLEFKRMPNEDRVKYLKTVIAFANGKGGTILFGVANDGSVLGIDKSRVFAEMDGITNSICNACSPRVPIDIGIEDVGGKSVIVLDVLAGSRCPYFLKAEGDKDGVYVRIGATTQRADDATRHELPPDALRELVINAFAHRNYFEHDAPIFVAVYDTRVEITSPGGLPRGLTVERVLSGRSKIRNHALAEAFNYMNVIEQWGSGLRRVSEELAAYGAKPLQLEDGGIDVRVNVLRNVPAVEPSRKGAQKNTPIGIVDGTMDGTMALRIVSVLKNEPSITIDKLSERLNVARRSLVRYMNILQESNRIKRIGGKRFGHWEVIQGQERKGVRA